MSSAHLTGQRSRLLKVSHYTSRVCISMPIYYKSSLLLVNANRDNIDATLFFSRYPSSNVSDNGAIPHQHVVQRCHPVVRRAAAHAGASFRLLAHTRQWIRSHAHFTIYCLLGKYLLYFIMVYIIKENVPTVYRNILTKRNVTRKILNVWHAGFLAMLYINVKQVRSYYNIYLLLFFHKPT